MRRMDAQQDLIIIRISNEKENVQFVSFFLHTNDFIIISFWKLKCQKIVRFPSNRNQLFIICLD